MDHEKNIADILKSFDPKTKKLTARKNTRVEFKESFNWGSRSSYAKSMAAFANNQGGYLIFGVTNSPRTLVGLTSSNFEDQDEAIITAYLNGSFSPEIKYEKIVANIDGKKNRGHLHLPKHNKTNYGNKN